MRRVRWGVGIGESGHCKVTSSQVAPPSWLKPLPCPPCFLVQGVRVFLGCAPLCRCLSSGWCRPRPSDHSCLARAPPSGWPGIVAQNVCCWIFVPVWLSSNVLTNLHSPGQFPTVWSECVASRFHPSGPKLQDCTASPSSRTLATCPRGGLPGCGGTTGTDCRRSRAAWEEEPAAPPARFACFPPRE